MINDYKNLTKTDIKKYVEILNKIRPKNNQLSVDKNMRIDVFKTHKRNALIELKKTQENLQNDIKKIKEHNKKLDDINDI